MNIGKPYAILSKSLVLVGLTWMCGIGHSFNTTRQGTD